MIQIIILVFSLTIPLSYLIYTFINLLISDYKQSKKNKNRLSKLYKGMIFLSGDFSNGNMSVCPTPIIINKVSDDGMVNFKYLDDKKYIKEGNLSKNTLINVCPHLSEFESDDIVFIDNLNKQVSELYYNFLKRKL